MSDPLDPNTGQPLNPRVDSGSSKLGWIVIIVVLLAFGGAAFLFLA